jgi:hypothetical protein
MKKAHLPSIEEASTKHSPYNSESKKNAALITTPQLSFLFGN